eukprot:CAMPEP_0118895658 /NCGR_PEP_ID=MMETSP1166-20130328/3909_1 /TAXON_ID=1104430 /ORGANISM="Chrysoreinhardia sp, Strain CCMP3193" /LENGTH=113 /DNA_ID=CAMNT_0006834703 /DNA_START=116 /DNA_END=453 /DNA_ORIENTATION=+
MGGPPPLDDSEPCPLKHGGGIIPQEVGRGDDVESDRSGNRPLGPWAFVEESSRGTLLDVDLGVFLLELWPMSIASFFRRPHHCFPFDVVLSVIAPASLDGGRRACVTTRWDSG